MNRSTIDRFARTSDSAPRGGDVRSVDVVARDPINSQLSQAGQPGDTVASAAPERGGRNVCKLLQRVDDRSPDRANAQALDDLAAGADGLSLVFQGAPNAFGHGLPASPEALAAALRDIPLGKTHLRIDVHSQSRASVEWLVRLLAARKVAPEKLDICFGVDPAGIFAGTGMLRMSIEALMASLPQSLAHFFALGVPGVLLEADGRVFHNAGASDAQELGVMMASAVGYLRMFEEARQPAIYAAAHVGFAVSVEQDRPAAAVKLAALHRLWERVLASYDVPTLPMIVHAETSYRMLTASDTEANATRVALAALSAIEAGASTVCGLPHDIVSRLPDEASRRRARTALSVLLREGGIAPRTVPEPAFLADRIDRLADAAWQELSLIESEGGILRSVRDGRIQHRIAAARDDRAAGLGLSPMANAAFQRNGWREAAPEGAVFCQRLDPIRWEEFSAAEAA